MNILKKCRYGNMILNRRDRWVGDSLDIYGEFSEAEVEVFRKYVKPGDVVLDIGANIGAHTVAFSQLVGERGTVIAIEPERTNYYALCGNIALNNCVNTIAYQWGVGNISGALKVPIINVPQNSNFGSLELDKDWSGTAHYVVPCVRLDDVGLSGCNFIKMDVEGMERLALEGGAEMIRKYHPILYVEDDRAEKSAELRAFIVSLGYKIEEHAAPLFNTDNFNNVTCNVFGGIVSKNLLCLKN